ncbi:RHS repeat domain-containing protein [Roseibacillus ishigakijimensis]|uniref:RHS repeat-associated core domain-containing protein n=1 Tax=Roseibacillus ishigakijimensis TaxID=454146 RepID=A0A934VMD5_9BACT|nr:RHS repeat-associated core domain-containing protein [Roseibacillus ishigakijimensis]MBK1834167.1 hypothetical protein [Roseibacillus ishigakijimensis]
MKRKQIALALGASVAASASLSAAIPSEKYVYDASGNIVEKQIGEQVTYFDYAGNLLKGSLRDSTQKQYLYDEAGRLVGEVEGGNVVRKLNYRFADKVTKVQNEDKTTELFYNAEGQLVGINSAGSLEAFTWDGLAMVSRGAQAFSNEQGGIGESAILIGDDISVSDILGSTLAVGRESYESSAFGEGLEEVLFTGKPYIKELEVFVFKFRNYSTDSMRWSILDPSGYPDGENNYAYVSGDPVGNVDPSGLSQISASPAPPVPSGWSRYNSFYTESPDLGPFNRPSFMSGNVRVNVRDEYEYKRFNPSRKVTNIPQNSTVQVSYSTGAQVGGTGGVSIYSAVNVSVSASVSSGYTLSTTVDAYKKGTPEAFDHISQCWTYKEKAYEYTYHNYQGPASPNNNVWTLYSGSRGAIGYSDNIIGQAVEK